MNSLSLRFSCMLWTLSLVLIPLPAVSQALPDIASRSVKDLGKVVSTFQADSGRAILIEEEHTSRVGQIEIANILVRLYSRNGLRMIGLEGSTVPRLEPTWATKMLASDRLRIAARLLGDGELSSAEFVASAFSDVTVIGIDSPSDYKVELDDKAAVSEFIYLMLIAESSLSPADQAKFSKLLGEKKLNEAMDFAIDADPWTRRFGSLSKKKQDSVSTESMLKQLGLIEGEASKRHIAIPTELSADFQRLKTFMQAASRRSDYMVEQLARLVTAPDRPLVVGVIGAAHTEKMTALLRERKIAHAVVRPNAYDQHPIEATRIEEMESYRRKLKGRTVDDRGLGGLLDTHRKPPPVVNQRWLERKAAVYQATLAVVDKVLVAGGQPPYEFPSLPSGYRVDSSQISRIGEEIVFPIEFEGENGKQQTIWVRAAYSRNAAARSKDRQSIDERIERLLQDAGGGGRDGNGKPPRFTDAQKPEDPLGKKRPNADSKKPNEGSRQIAEGIYATFSSDRATAEKQAVLSASRV